MTPDSVGAAPRRLDPSISEWICLVAGSFFLLRYAWILDDAFVYFRYVDNLLFLGHGLVYNAGEFVEGYSSPFWTLLLIPLRALRLDYWLITRLVGLLSFFAFWLLAVRIRRDIGGGQRGLNLPLCFLSFNYAFACYFSSGIEAPLVQLSAALYGYFALRPRARWLQLLVGLTPLVRHEFLVVLLVAAVYSFWRTRRLPIWLLASCAASLGPWLVFRVYYYADLVPNTFHLKDTTNYSQGLRYLWDSLEAYGLYLILPLLWGLGRFRGGCWRARLAMIVFALPVLVYVVRIGGDPRHYRYLAFPICLLLFSTMGIAEAWLEAAPARWRGRVAAGLVAATMLLSLSLYPRQLAAHPMRGNVGHTARWEINDALLHRYHELLRRDPWAWSSADQLDAYAEYVGRGRKRAYPRQPVVGWWCASLYEEFDRRIVHGLGLTDGILSRVDMPADRPAHKMGLIPLATQLGELYQRSSVEPRRGYFRAAGEQGAAPSWIVDNLAAIEVAERRIYNEHHFMENLRLAFSSSPRIQLSADHSVAPSQSSQ